MNIVRPRAEVPALACSRRSAGILLQINTSKSDILHVRCSESWEVPASHMDPAGLSLTSAVAAALLNLACPDEEGCNSYIRRLGRHVRIALL